MSEELEMNAASWLASARGEARRLTEERLAMPARALDLGDERPRFAWLRFGAGLAALGLVCASASWAWVRHRKGEPRSSDLAAPVVVMASQSSGAKAAPVSHAAPTTDSAVRVAKHKRVVPKEAAAVLPAASDTRVQFELEGPDDEVIVGRVPLKQPPLFTTEEYKARGVMVR